MDIFDDMQDVPRQKNCPVVTSLFNAASRNQLEKLNDIICKNPLVDYTESVNSFNCFHVASKKGHLGIVKRIHEVYPNIVSSRTTDNQRSSLMLAAFEGHVEVAKYLSNFELETAVDALGNNALHYACWSGQLLIVKYLIEENHFDPAAKNGEGLGAMQFAAAGKHVDIVNFLLKYNPNQVVNEISDSGFNSLHRAAISGSLDTIKLLLSTKGSQNSPDISVECRAHNGCSVLHLAAQYGNIKIVQYLVEEFNAGINVQNNYSLTPLHFACIGGHTDLVQYFIKRGADVHCKNASGSTALHLAAASGRHLICAMLAKQKGIQLLLRDSEGHSAIDVALQAGYKELAGKLSLWSCIELRSQTISSMINEIHQ